MCASFVLHWKSCMRTRLAPPSAIQKQSKSMHWISKEPSSLQKARAYQNPSHSACLYSYACLLLMHSGGTAVSGEYTMERCYFVKKCWKSIEHCSYWQNDIAFGSPWTGGRAGRGRGLSRLGAFCTCIVHLIGMYMHCDLSVSLTSVLHAYFMNGIFENKCNA